MDLEQYFDGFTARDWQERTEGTVRLALVGLGWWTREKAIPAIEESDLCTAAVAVSGSAEKASRVAGTADMAAGITYGEYHDGAAAGEYDAVYVCTPNATHLEYVETAADLGKAVLCEKPMAATVEGGEAMVEACEAAGVPLMVAYRMQTEPAVRRTRELVEAGFVGDPVHVHGQMSDDVLALAGGPDQWRLDPALSGGTTVNDIGIYPLNTARFVLDADPVAVYGHTRSAHPAFEGVDEHAAFQVEFPGVTAACTVSHNAHTASHLRVVGTEGEVTVEPAFFPWTDRRLRVARGDLATQVDFEQVNQMTEEFDYFADCLLSDRDPVPDGEHGLVDLRAIEAVYDSAETGRRVEL